MGDLLGAAGLVAVEFYSVRPGEGRQAASPLQVVARATVPRLTAQEGHGWIDLGEDETAACNPQTGFARLWLVPTDAPEIAETFGWTVAVDGTVLRTVAVSTPDPADPAYRTVTVDGQEWPAVWLFDLADFTSPGSTTAPATDPLAITVLHGDSWESTWFVVAVDGEAPDPDVWTVRAQVRGTRAGPALFEWTALLGHPEGTGVAVTKADAKLKSGVTVELPAIQLQLDAAGWSGKPANWAGFLEVELTRGPLTAPTARRTIVRRRPFRIVPDLLQ